LLTEHVGEPRTAQAFIDLFHTDQGFNNLLRGVAAFIDGPEQGMTDTETRRKEAIHRRVQATFNKDNPNWKAALENTRTGRRVDDRVKRILRGMIRNRPLQYMEAWAMMTGDDTWLPAENDIQRIRRLDTEGLVDEEYLERQSPEEIERIGRRLGSDRVKKKIDDGTLLLEDPDLAAYETQRKEALARAETLIAERKEGLKDYRWMLETAERNARKEQLLFEQRASDTSAEGLKASKAQTRALAKAHQQVQNVVNQMEQFTRNDLTPTQRAAFLELRNQLRERERIQAELNAINQIRDIKKRALSQILRRPDLNTVSTVEARLIEWVQSHYDSYQAVARYIGRGAKDIQQLYNEFATSPEYREALKRKLPASTYYQIERIVFRDMASREVRAYADISAHQRKVLYNNLQDFQGIFEETGIDIRVEPRKFSPSEYTAIRAEMQNRISADLLYKLEGLLVKDGQGGRRFRVADFNIEDIQTLAGAVNRLRKEGRERLAAQNEARAQLRDEAREKIHSTVKANMPGDTDRERMQGTIEARRVDEKRSSLRKIWYSLHNPRRFFRRLEGGRDGFLYSTITNRVYDAFDQKERYVDERRVLVENQLKEHGIRIQDIYNHSFELWNGDRVTLDEMLSFYYAQYNERALHAVIFGDFATPQERSTLKAMADNSDQAGQMHLEGEIAQRYWNDIKKLDAFLAQEGNEKFRAVMEIIGRDYDRHYERLKEFVAMEYNEVLGNEPNYMPLQRLGTIAQEATEVELALSEAGLSRYINKGFTKGRVDIPSWGQQPIKAGLYSLWAQTVDKQEHLMAFDPLMREFLYIFEGQGSETLRDTLRRGHSQAALDYIRDFISEMAQTSAQLDISALNGVSRFIRGHFPAAVLGWRFAASLNQLINTPPPFFQFVSPFEYIAAKMSCLRKETRDMVREKSIFMKVRYVDPSIAVIKEMENMATQGKLGKIEAVTTKISATGMYLGQQLIDMFDTLPGWLAAYRKKEAELNRTAADSMTLQEIDAAAIRFADQVVRDCQPSSVMMDRVPILKNLMKNKNPLLQIFTQFQTPAAVIFQNLFIDAPIKWKQGRYLDAMWAFVIYASIGVAMGVLRDDPEERDNLRHRAGDAANGLLYAIPIFGSGITFAVQSYVRDGRMRLSSRSDFPVADSAVRAFNAANDEDWARAASSMVDALFFATGLPAAKKRDIERAIENGEWQRLFGIR